MQHDSSGSSGACQTGGLFGNGRFRLASVAVSSSNAQHGLGIRSCKRDADGRDADTVSRAGKKNRGLHGGIRDITDFSRRRLAAMGYVYCSCYPEDLELLDSQTESDSSSGSESDASSGSDTEETNRSPKLSEWMKETERLKRKRMVKRHRFKDMMDKGVLPAPHDDLKLHLLRPFAGEDSKTFAHRILHTGVVQSSALRNIGCHLPSTVETQSMAVANAIVNIVVAFVGVQQVFQSFNQEDVRPGGRFHVAGEEHLKFMLLPEGPQISRGEFGMVRDHRVRYTSPWVNAELYSCDAFVSAMTHLGFTARRIPTPLPVYLFEGKAKTDAVASSEKSGPAAKETREESACEACAAALNHKHVHCVRSSIRFDPCGFVGDKPRLPGVLTALDKSDWVNAHLPSFEGGPFPLLQATPSLRANGEIQGVVKHVELPVLTTACMACGAPALPPLGDCHSCAGGPDGSVMDVRYRSGSLHLGIPGTDQDILVVLSESCVSTLLPWCAPHYVNTGDAAQGEICRACEGHTVRLKVYGYVNALTAMTLEYIS